MKMTLLEMSKGHGNNTNKNNLNDNNMNLSFPSGDSGMEHGTDGDYSYYHEYFLNGLRLKSSTKIIRMIKNCWIPLWL